MEIPEFSPVLRAWFKASARALPWRETKDPYRIWLSEIILQQTRVDQGIGYYLRFVEAFPDVRALAEADDDHVMRLWQGLGYYSRARNLLAAARQVADFYGGQFPQDYERLLELKGVGEYTAAAIASFAFDLPNAVVDGNVFRFISRLFGVRTPIDSGEGKKEFAVWAAGLLDRNHPAEHNQAMMEMGATVCKPKNPACTECPFSLACHAYIQGEIEQLPVKAGRTRVEVRYLQYFFVSDGEFTWIRKRMEKGIWQDLFEWPGVETVDEKSTPVPPHEIRLALEQGRAVIRGVPVQARHLLSHRDLRVQIWKVHFEGELPDSALYRKVELDDLKDFAMPRLFTRYLEQHG
ncbi:MAG: hypothetical protein RLZZ630_570 [Bacteroidota bacterium]|jgi:A/G-specific adenine glycosylase